MSKSKILVVDDNLANVKMLRDRLRATGYEVVEAYDGEEALEQVEEEAPDLILLDVMMPKMDGFEVCRRLKDDKRTLLIPVVMVTALRERADRLRGIEVGADDFLTKPVDHAELTTRVKSLLRMKRHTDELESAETVIGSLAVGVEAKDPYTEGHCARLSAYSVKVGERIGLSAEALKALRRGGVLHDVGKIGISETILLKRGKLTEEEYAAIKEHPVIGERICSPMRSLGLVLPIIRHHHERMDGSGYPDGLRGEKTPVTARTMAIVDVYDALRTERPYKPALSVEESLGTLWEESERGWWDPGLVREFERIIVEE